MEADKRGGEAGQSKPRRGLQRDPEELFLLDLSSAAPSTTT